MSTLISLNEICSASSCSTGGDILVFQSVYNYLPSIWKSYLDLVEMFLFQTQTTLISVNFISVSKFIDTGKSDLVFSINNTTVIAFLLVFIWMPPSPYGTMCLKMQ